MQYCSSIGACQIVICIVAFRKAIPLKNSKVFYGLANPSMQSITLFSRRPQRITTEEFGWSLSYEKVKLTTASVKQPAQFMKIMETAGFNSIPH